ncbi:acetyltransferase [Bifidobacterium myosotis]|uniref:Acetyltransferase n=1 Tax=Bifidobacterium myosotis TaxID=1630166 RepID=A0A5M9ZGY5_9BIFI|nr:acetyltransferase [Bifidobacterium myosotis]
MHRRFDRHYIGLDGIKGLALIAIVLYHCMQQVLPGGFYGVDVFFTVSGFLIGVSLFRSLARTGSVNLARYIPHRAVRLYPALFLLIPVIVSAGWLLDRDLLVNIRDQIITVLLGCYNWYAIAGGQSYFDQMNPQVFRHLWFIGVLMQFYVVVPLLAWLMWKIRRTHLSAVIPLALAAVSGYAMWALYRPGGDPTRVYFGTDTHAVGLMLGLALAWWVTAHELNHPRPKPVARSVSSVVPSAPSAPSAPDYAPDTSATPAASGKIPEPVPLPDNLSDATQRPDTMHVPEPLSARIWRAVAPVLAFLSLIALIVMAVCGKQDDFAFRGGIIISSVLAVLLIAGTISPDSWMQDLMVFRPLKALGAYSYGIYLWHWPLWLLSRALAPKLFPVPGPWPLGMTAVLTVIAAVISWMMVEKPAARRSALFVILPIRHPGAGHIVRAVVVDAILVASLFGATQGVMGAPAKTAMQLELERQAEQLEQTQRKEHVLLRHQVPKPPRPKFAMPTGDQITAIGDSVMLASSQGLSSVFPGIQTDAAVSRSILVAPGMIQEDLAAGSLRQWVVVGLGTNSAITPDELDQVYNEIGSDRVLVLVNAHGDRTWIPPTNQVLADYAAAHPDNVVLVDWDAAANANPQVFGADGIHPSMDSDLYAQTIKKAIARWIGPAR